MSKLSEKVSAAANQAAGVIVKAGAKQGKAGLAVANAVCATFLGTYVQMCDDGPECTDPNHEHIDLQLRQR